MHVHVLLQYMYLYLKLFFYCTVYFNVQQSFHKNYNIHITYRYFILKCYFLHITIMMNGTKLYLILSSNFRRYRYVAYRAFVRLCWGPLGREVRVQIPSCAVNRIRREYPSPSAEYVGFKFPHLTR